MKDKYTVEYSDSVHLKPYALSDSNGFKSPGVGISALCLIPIQNGIENEM